MIAIVANDLKVSGIQAIANALEDEAEALISVRGKNRYVVMDIDRYQQIREIELEAALRESRADARAGRVLKGGIAGHLKRIAHG